VAEGQFGWLLLILFTTVLIAGPDGWRSMRVCPEPFMPDTPSLRKPGTEETVTLIVKHRVKAGFEQPYEAWLRNIVSVAGRGKGTWVWT
jgi:hypothetical protein